MKFKEMKDLGLDELQAKEKEFREEEFQLRFKHATGQLDKTSRLKELRRNIARVKTLIRQKEASQ
jgi:large subunit ribosomal protein L29